jgi:outer membrane protein OmpA-like peptidoglycan-associated protein
LNHSVSFSLKKRAKGTVDVKEMFSSNSGSQAVKETTNFKLGTALSSSLGSFTLYGTPMFEALQNGTELVIQINTLESTVDRLKGNISIESVNKDASALHIKHKGPVAALNNDIINTLIEEHEKHNIRDKNEVTESTSDFIKERMFLIEKELREAKEREAALAAEKLPDADGDGVPDINDLCPDKAGPWGASGCPDTDGDDIPDHIDECPDVYGAWKEKGCPEITSEVKEVLQKALEGVYFETGQAILKKESFKALDAVIGVMKDNPTCKLKISGHTDNVGEDDANMQLSKDRAQAVSSI